MQRLVIKFLVSLSVLVAMVSTVAVANESSESNETKPQPSHFNYMLRGYFFAGSAIPDTNAYGGYGGSNNYPNDYAKIAAYVDQSFGQPVRDTVQIVALHEESVVFKGQFVGMPVLIVNGSSETLHLDASDSRLYMVQEALNEAGEWVPVEHLPQSWCGNSRHQVSLRTGQYWEFAAPKYTGTFTTKLRVALDLPGGQTIYSNVYPGAVNVEQFSVKAKYSPRGLMDPYTE